MALILRRGRAEDLFNFVRPYRAGFAPVSTFKLNRQPVEFCGNDVPSEDAQDFAVREGDDVLVSGDVLRNGTIRSYAIYNYRTGALASRSPVRNFVVGTLILIMEVFFETEVHGVRLNNFVSQFVYFTIPLAFLSCAALIIIPGLKTLGSVKMIKNNMKMVIP
jgi:hypothetical protein